jgi:hypothetical protein
VGAGVCRARRIASRYSAYSVLAAAVPVVRLRPHELVGFVVRIFGENGSCVNDDIAKLICSSDYVHDARDVCEGELGDKFDEKKGAFDTLALDVFESYSTSNFFADRVAELVQAMLKIIVEREKHCFTLKKTKRTFVSPKIQGIAFVPVSPPLRKGFGLQVIERGLAQELDGSAKLDFPATGLIFTLDFPASRAASGR